MITPGKVDDTLREVWNIAKPKNKAKFAIVVEVLPEKGVKIKIDGDNNPLNTYFNSYVEVSPGDRVGLQYVSGTILIEGKLLY